MLSSRAAQCYRSRQQRTICTAHNIAASHQGVNLSRTRLVNKSTLSSRKKNNNMHHHQIQSRSFLHSTTRQPTPNLPPRGTNFSALHMRSWIGIEKKCKTTIMSTASKLSSYTPLPHQPTTRMLSLSKNMVHINSKLSSISTPLFPNTNGKQQNFHKTQTRFFAKAPPPPKRAEPKATPPTAPGRPAKRWIETLGERKKKRSAKKATRPVDIYKIYKDEDRMEPTKPEDVPKWLVEMAEKWNEGTLFKPTDEYSPYDGQIYWRRKRRERIKLTNEYRKEMQVKPEADD